MINFATASSSEYPMTPVAMAFSARRRAFRRARRHDLAPIVGLVGLLLEDALHVEAFRNGAGKPFEIFFPADAVEIENIVAADIVARGNGIQTAVPFPAG